MRIARALSRVGVAYCRSSATVRLHRHPCRVAVGAKLGETNIIMENRIRRHSNRNQVETVLRLIFTWDVLSDWFSMLTTLE